MTNLQSAWILLAGAAVGFALGAAYEHQRFLAELKSLRDAHSEPEGVA